MCISPTYKSKVSIPKEKVTVAVYTLVFTMYLLNLVEKSSHAAKLLRRVEVRYGLSFSDTRKMLAA